ncbi:MAG: PLP-dependent transferase, partial [Nitrospiraceae bacterium]
DERKYDPDTFIDNLKLISPALSLGGVETLICAPASTSHEKMSEEERLSIGITKGLVRLSVGVEDADDIMKDIEQALS